MQIYLMRHGDPTYREPAELGLPGMGSELGKLRPEGIAQAEEAAKDPRIQDVDLIVSSPYPRALQTAAIVSRRIDRPIDIAVGIFEWLPDVRYTAPSHAEIYNAWQEFKRNGGVHTPDDEYPHWETHAQMRARALKSLQPFLERTDLQKLLIVCHGGIMRALMNEPSRRKIHFCEIIELTEDMLTDSQ